MAGSRAASARRRTPSPPWPGHGEIVRVALVERLAGRFSVPVTVVAAGAGLGKSTLLAQAIRANLAEPCGIDAWVSCEDGDGDAGRLADAIVDALGAREDRERPLDRVRDALAALAPLDVCLVLDDVHVLPRGSSGAAMIAELVADLPPHVHLLLGGRREPEVALARWRAGGLVIDVEADELTFTEDEVARFARAMGVDGDVLADVGGWPSLLRLAISAPAGSGRRFLWEEVVATLDPVERRQLLALSSLGSGTAGEVMRIAGLTERPDLDELARRVPLISRGDGGRFGVHQLWEDAIDRLLPRADRDLVRARVLEVCRERGETIRGGWLALRWADAAAMRDFAVDLVRDSFGALPVDTAARWLADAPAPARRSPELDLLDLALLQAQRFDDVRLDAAVPALVERFRRAGDDRGEAVAVALAAVVAQCLGRLHLLFELSERASRLAAGSEVPWLPLLDHAMRAAIASLVGDPAAAAAALAPLDQRCLPSGFSELVVRLHANMLAFDGRADEAVVVAAPLTRAPSAYVRTIPCHLRWLAGDPSGFAAGWPGGDPGDDTNERYLVYHATYGTSVAASFGDLDALDELRPVIEKFASSASDGRERAMTAVATATRLVAEHDEAGARQVIGEHVDHHGPDDALADMHLRRTLAVPYVLDERVRRRWGDADLGPSQRSQRAVAEALLAARDGRLRELPPPEHVFTALPLVWSTELAAIAAASRLPGSVPLARFLHDLAPAATHAELRRMLDGEHVAASGAERLLGALPDPTRPTVAVDVLGPLAVSCGPVASEGVELRRERVRTLLELLVVAGPLPRRRVADIMWPDAEPEVAARSLRVTLTRLRHALDPDDVREGRSIVIAEDDRLALAAPPATEVDLWAFDREVTDAEDASARGDNHAAIELLTSACGRWRGEPFPDLAEIDAVRGEREAVCRRVEEAAIRLGELLLVAGRFDGAAAWADRVLSASPYRERAHRLAIAAHVQRRDPSAATRAVRAAQVMLEHLDVDPEPSTRMLFRQAALLGRVDADG